MVNRRNFLKFGAVSAVTTPLLLDPEAQSAEALETGGKDYSPLSGTEREPIATTCALCSSCCPAMGFVENDILVKMEGLPESTRSMGNLCARGQAGVNQAYDPDRILQPMKRVGGRGEGNWEKISWEDALSELSKRLQKLRDTDQAEKFLFHHGQISASADRLINQVFMPSYGSASIANDDSLERSSRFTAHQLTWGAKYDSWDFDNTRFVLNFGSNVLESDSNYLAHARRLSDALIDRNVKMITFDVRLSNTAAKSDSWIPVKPGTDAAVVLAICNVIMEKKLYSGQGEKFLSFCKVTEDPNASVKDKIKALEQHLANYTPAWAEKISGVSAKQIADIAVQFASSYPACVISSGGISGHQNGVETERAIQMLAAITGNIDNLGGRCLGVSPQWRFPDGPESKPVSKRPEILDGHPDKVVLPIYGVGNQVLSRAKDAQLDRPEVYLWYKYNPVLSNPEIQQNLDILKDETIFPYTVAVTSVYDESAALADIILPDSNYLETYDFEEGVSPTQVAEYSIRQPVIKPQGEARDFKDVCCELANIMGFPLGFNNAQEFLEQACELTKDIQKIGGLDTMKQIGVWSDKKAKPSYLSYRKTVDKETLKKSIFDKNTGVYWDWKASDVSTEEQAINQGYQKTSGAYKGYLAQQIDGAAYSGFKPEKLNKSGRFEIYSSILAEKGMSALPGYSPNSKHDNKKEDELILTTFQLNVQTPSITQNCRWLNEICDENHAWINTATAAEKDINNGDKIWINSRIGKIEITAKVTQLITPGIIAVPNHGVHWESGRYASGKSAPFSVEKDSPYEELKWWKHEGKHPNWIIVNTLDPISGQQCGKDTLVSISKI